ncbi:hypothetical protein [Cohnella sp.]|uniref:hypothetical protein n=1 Tax=Cohnella sp. TaxID=1883426 RepID=UPI00257D9C70|nr:hypothetical protein [Cohnella sp.]
MWVVQFALAAIGFSALLRVLFWRRPRWRVSWRTWKRWSPPLWWLKLTGCDRESPALQERRVLLAGCGIRFDPAVYLAARRSLLTVLPAAGAGIRMLGDLAPIPGRIGWNALVAVGLLFLLAAYDRPLLAAAKRYRTDRIRSELVAISSQLLYYAGSRLHLHGKLMRCMPYARLIRGELHMLLNEWYHDADAALVRFKDRLGTSEAYGFAETIRSLRLGESEEIYHLLREMVREYKAKIEMARAGRKETASYGLFVLAGIPILYTFQIFLYPWVQEAQKLFDALNS